MAGRSLYICIYIYISSGVEKGGGVRMENVVIKK